MSTAERDSAIDALTVHVQAGRLDLAEFEKRAAAASEAEFRAYLTMLFEDLPEPHPQFQDSTEVALPQETTVATPHSDGNLLRNAAYSLFPMAGAIAIVLVVVAGWPVWLLIIPPVLYFVWQWAKRSQREG